jgi:glycosyltransferase involved in cell wall biosynthesis
MTLWYSASDVFISASHHEGSGYALIEAIHCGCYPVITNIPTFSKITDNGNQGSLFKTGDTKEVADLLKNLPDKAFHNGRNSRIAFAHEELSFQKMARQFENACKKVIGSHLATKLYN